MPLPPSPGPGTGPCVSERASEGEGKRASERASGATAKTKAPGGIRLPTLEQALWPGWPLAVHLFVAPT